MENATPPTPKGRVSVAKITMIKTMLKGFGVLCISAVLMTCVMVGIGELNAFFASQISDWMKMGVAGLMCLFVIAFVLYVLGSFVEES